MFSTFVPRSRRTLKLRSNPGVKPGQMFVKTTVSGKSLVNSRNTACQRHPRASDGASQATLRCRRGNPSRVAVVVEMAFTCAGCSAGSSISSSHFLPTYFLRGPSPIASHPAERLGIGAHEETVLPERSYDAAGLFSSATFLRNKTELTISTVALERTN